MVYEELNSEIYGQTWAFESKSSHQRRSNEESARYAAVYERHQKRVVDKIRGGDI